MPTGATLSYNGLLTSNSKFQSTFKEETSNSKMLTL